MKLSDKLIALRKECGWSQEEFAEKLDVSRQAISRWENGTALPDAQNILRISKLCNVTADFLLNEDYEGESASAAAETAAAQTEPSVPKRKNKQGILIPILCIILLSAFAIYTVTKPGDTPTNEAHTHHALTRTVENEQAPSCTQQGSYDEVICCAECGEELLRTHISTGMPAHQFENQKCIICGEIQRARD